MRKTIAPALPPNVDKLKVYVPQPGDFDNLKETTMTTLLSSAVEVILPALLILSRASAPDHEPSFGEGPRSASHIGTTK